MLKAIKKPDLVIVSIAPWTDRETIKKMAKNDADRKKAERLSAAMSVQGQGDFTFFEGYKKVPCGIVAMTFNDVYYLKDFSMVVRGAKFHPDRKK